MRRKSKLQKQLKVASDLFQQNQFEDAFELTSRLIEKYPSNAKAEIFQLKAMVKLRKPSIFKRIEEIAISWPEDNEVLFELAKISYNISNFNQCLEFCRSASRDSEDTQVNLLMARTMGKLGKKEESSAIFDQLIEKDNQNVSIVEWGARVAYEIKDYERANHLLKSLIQLNGENAVTERLKRGLSKNYPNENRLTESKKQISSNEMKIDFIKSYLQHGLSDVAFEQAKLLWLKHPESPRVTNLYSETIVKTKDVDAASELIDTGSDLLLIENMIKLYLLTKQFNDAHDLCLQELSTRDSKNIYQLFSNVLRQMGDEQRAQEFDIMALDFNKYDLISWKRTLLSRIQHKKTNEEHWKKLSQDASSDTKSLYLCWELALEFSNEKVIQDLKKEIEHITDQNDIKNLYKISMKFGRLDMGKYFCDLYEKGIQSSISNSVKIHWQNQLDTLEMNQDEFDQLISNGMKHKIEFICHTLQRKCNARQHLFIENYDNSGPIIFLSNTLGIGGSEKQLTNLATLLKSNSSDREVIILIADKNSVKNDQNKIQYLEDKGIQIFSFDDGKAIKHISKIDNSIGSVFHLIDNLPNLVMKRRINNLIALFHRFKPSIVQSWQDQCNFLAGITSMVYPISKMILCCRSLPPNQKSKAHQRNTNGIKGVYSSLNKCKFIQFNHNSKYGKKSYSNFTGIDEKDMTHIQNIVNLPDLNNQKEKRKNFVVGGVFRFVPEKRPLYWIDIAEKLLEKNKNLKFVIYGDGPLFKEVDSRISKSLFTSNFELRGFETELDLIYSEIDLLLHVAEIEGMPNVVLEAQSYGIPVACSPSGGTIEAMIPNDTGIVLDDLNQEIMIDTLFELIEDKKQLAKMSTKAKGFIKYNHSPEIVLPKWLELYQIER